MEMDIKELRTRLNCSQAELAEKIGVHWRTVQNWENGGVIPKTKLAQLQELAASDPEPQDVYSRLLDLVERSEARIDKTNEMVRRLSETCTRNMDMYDKHLTSLEHSRDVTQENSTLLLRNYNTLLEEVAELRKELSSAKESYGKLFDAYIRLSESLSHKDGGSRADVKVTM